METTQETLVARQFGPQAAAYVASAVHAQGEDLQQLASLAKSFGPKTVLDLGCGGGHVAFAVAPHARHSVVAYDLSAEMLAAVSAEAERRGLHNVTTRQGAAERLPFADREFCMVASRFSAHHWSDLRAGLREARRVAKPGALGVFIDVVSPGTPLLDTSLQTLEMLRDPSHVRNYSMAEWQEALASAGFAVRRAQSRRLPLEFGPWIARINTPDSHVQAIRSLQSKLSQSVRAHFAIQDDGGFALDTAVFEVEAAD